MPAEVLEAAAALKRELPQRSVRSIIEILEEEGRVKRGIVAALHPGQALHEAGADGDTQDAQGRLPALSKGAPELPLAGGSQVRAVPARL